MDAEGRIEFAQAMDRALASEDAQRDWQAFAAWAEATWSAPADLKAARRAEKFVTPALLDAIARAFATWRPPEYPKSRPTICYALFLAVRDGGADREIEAYLNGLIEDQALTDRFRAFEILMVSRYLEWSGRTSGPLAETVRQMLKLDLFQADPTLTWARSLGLEATDATRWTGSISYSAQPGGRERGQTFLAGLSLTIAYPASGGFTGLSAYLNASFNYPRAPHAIYDLSIVWRAGREPEVKTAEPELAARFAPQALPRLERLDEFPRFRREIKALIGAAFDPGKAKVTGFSASDRSRVKAWLKRG